jgi:hypothetical protein
MWGTSAFFMLGFAVHNINIALRDELVENCQEGGFST